MKKNFFSILCILFILLSFVLSSCARDNAEGQKMSMSGPGYSLEIYGNANGDWYIDSNDIDSLKNIIDGKESPGEFADANHDGVIDKKDIDQVQSLIDKKAGTMWFLDGNGREVELSLPVERIGVEYLSNSELMNVLGVSDKVVAVDSAAYLLRDFYFPQRNDLMNMGAMYKNPDFEKIFDMNLDVLFTFPSVTDTKQTALPDTKVIFLGLYWPNVINPEDSRFFQGVIKAGYILGKQERAYEYADWLLSLVKEIGGRTKSIPSDELPSVLMTSYNRYFKDGETMAASIYTKIDPLSQSCMLAGGNPVARLIPEWQGEKGVYGTKISLEWIMEQDPEYIFAHSVRYTYSGIKRDPPYGYECSDRAPLDAAVEKIKELPLLKDLQAVKNNKVYITAGDFRNNAMGGILGAAYLAKIMHPELFSDFDPSEVHQQFISEWMGLDYNLDSNGVFIAPDWNN